MIYTFVYMACTLQQANKPQPLLGSRVASRITGNIGKQSSAALSHCVSAIRSPPFSISRALVYFHSHTPFAVQHPSAERDSIAPHTTDAERILHRDMLPYKWTLNVAPIFSLHYSAVRVASFPIFPIFA